MITSGDQIKKEVEHKVNHIVCEESWYRKPPYIVFVKYLYHLDGKNRHDKKQCRVGQCLIFVIHGWFEYNEKSSNRSCQKRQNKQNGPTCQIQCRIQIEPPVGGYKNNHKNSDRKCKQPDFFSCE